MARADDTRKKPSRTTLAVAQTIVGRILATGWPIERIACEDSGGVAIYLGGSPANRYAGFAVERGGAIAAFRSDRTPSGTHVAEATLKRLSKTLLELTEFRRGAT